MLNDLYVLFVFALAGIVIGLIFDVFRIARRAFKTPNIITYIEDFIFWIISGFIIIYVQYVYAKGETRLYLILTLIIGVLFYYLTISKIIMSANIKLINFFKKFIKKDGN